ncbi:Multidrug resistance protein NorM [Thalassoglobus neptunius]|uniref:Multidrug-efflux transporter n=2 Tax=Thalassoglobus neptunius TaxID=1938619 RepID=A0A5C5WPN3_9PLAN|nr:Multidrug resistance protein NorM [Thalassoglobus neptunius]
MSRAPISSANVDLMSGPLRTTVLFLALPVLGEQVLNFLVGFYDVYLAGNLTSDIRTDATAAVGVAAYVGWLASLIFSLVATGTTALISRAWGADDRDGANVVANRSLALSLVSGLLFTGVILFAAPTLVALMGLDGQAAGIAVRYLRVDAIGLLFSSFSLVLAAALRGCGDMKTPMWVFGSVSILNVIVSTALVHGVGPIEPWGVDGIVAGTVVARVCGGLLILTIFMMGFSGLSLVPSDLSLRGETVRRILAIGVPSGMEGIVMWVGHCIFLRVISGIGKTEFAAHIIGVRVEAITYLPAVAYGAAAATMVGQSLGAGNKERAVRAGHEAAMQCALLGVLITAWFVFGADWIYNQMNRDEAVRAVGIPAFRVVGLFQIPLILSIVYFAAIRGAGETKFPLYVAMFTTYLIRIPLGYFFGVTMEMGLMGAWVGMNADMFARGVIATWRFWSRRWLRVRV